MEINTCFLTDTSNSPITENHFARLNDIPQSYIPQTQLNAHFRHMSWNIIPLSHLGRCLEHVLAPYRHSLWQWWPLRQVSASAGQVAASPDCPHAGDTMSTGNNCVVVSCTGVNPSLVDFPGSLRVLCVSGALARLRKAFCLPLHISIHLSHPHTFVSSSLACNPGMSLQCQSSSSPHLTTPTPFTFSLSHISWQSNP